MRRIAVVLVLLAAALVAPSPAMARGVSDVVSTSGLPSDIKAVRAPCSPGPLDPPVPSPTTTAFRHVYGVVHPPLGKGSLRIDPAASKVPGLRVTRTASLAAMGALSVGSAATISGIFGFIYVSAGGHNWVLLANTADALPYAWVNYDLFHEQTWLWRDLTVDNGPKYPGGTISQFVTAHSPSPGFKVELLAGGSCFDLSDGPVFFDDLEVAVNGLTKRYDFESTTTGLTIGVNPSTIQRGAAVQVSTKFTDGGMPVPDHTVTLWAKKAGATGFTKIRTVDATTSTGGASVSLKPLKSTTYQWRYAGDVYIQASRSPKKTVQVTP